MLSEFFQQSLNNQVFNGMVGGSLFMTALYLLRGIPGALWEAFLWNWTTTLVIYSEDPAFERVSEWLASLEYSYKARRLMLRTKDSYDEANAHMYWTPGNGYHLIWRERVPLLVYRETSKDDSASWKRRETITVRTLGRSPQPMHALIQEMVEARCLDLQKKTEVYLYNDNYWTLAGRKDKRPLDTVILDEALKQRIVQDLEWFRRSRMWYFERGVPYRRGHYYYGPPGSGKTSLVLTLAGHLNLPVYMLNLGSLKSDDELFRATSTVPGQAFLLIEDVDAAKASHTRADDNDDEPKGITLSGLLNCLDGVFTKEGRILVMTTNHPDKIDPALTRPGRADLQVFLGNVSEPEVLRFCQLYLGPEGSAYASEISTPINPSELARILQEKARSLTGHGVV